jgi:hypothetical protein
MRWLLRLLVSDDDRRSIEADLAELYEIRRCSAGAPAADRWLRRQRFIYPWHLLMDRLRASVSRGTTMQHFWRDVGYSVRSLARVPALSMTIVLTIGVGLGATTAMISVVRAVLMNGLPYADPGSLVWIYTDNPPYKFRFSVVDCTVYYPLVDLASAYFVVRTAAVPSAISGTLRQTVAALDPQLALTDLATGDELVDDALSKPRYLTVFVGIFALTALVLSIVGVYGVMAYFVQQHARDIGIRLALGGDPFHVRRMVVLHGLRFVAAGVVTGMAAALLAGRLLTALLFGVSATDLRAVVGVPAMLILVAVVACLVPAHRAARLDPAQILRES